MSLHRVNSMSSYEHVRGSSPARSEHREVSFNPISKRASSIVSEEPLNAWQVSEAKRMRKKKSDAMTVHGRLYANTTRCSTDFRCFHILPLRSRDRLWVCCSKTCISQRGCLWKVLSTTRVGKQGANMLRARVTV